MRIKTLGCKAPIVTNKILNERQFNEYQLFLAFIRVLKCTKQLQDLQVIANHRLKKMTLLSTAEKQQVKEDAIAIHELGTMQSGMVGTVG